MYDLKVISKAGTENFRAVQRAKIVLEVLKGTSIKQVALLFQVRQNTVIDCRNRFEQRGIASLWDSPRSGRPVIHGDKLKYRLLNKLKEEPPNGLAKWDGSVLADVLNVPASAVWRILRGEGICLSRQRSWCVSADPEFVPKAADVVGLYLNPPVNAVVVSIDEKPSMQALSRKTGYVYSSNGKVVRAYQSTYKRNGTLNLFAALNVATGKITGKVTKYKKRTDFQDFMNAVVEEYPDQKIHCILDNYCIHKRNDDWLKEHPNVSFHYTPTSASWLNQVEIWFGIFSRKVLRGASHTKESLREAIEKYISACNENPTPFVWRKREVRGSQIADNIANLQI